MLGCASTWFEVVVTVALLAVFAVAGMPRLASQDWTVVLVLAWATASADPLLVLMAAQPTRVAATCLDRVYKS